MKSDGKGGAWARVCVLGLSLGLCGCVEAADEAAPVLARRQIERRDNVSLAPATVAVLSVEGAPGAVAESFSKSLASEAKARDIVMADPKKARYLVRGYLSATATSEGADVEYVWDVFGPDRSRAQRINDMISVKGQGGDPWAIAGEAALSSVAAKSAGDLAAFLSNTPDAKPVPAAARPGDSATALGYAPAQ